MHEPPSSSSTFRLAPPDPSDPPDPPDPPDPTDPTDPTELQPLFPSTPHLTVCSATVLVDFHLLTDPAYPACGWREERAVTTVA